MLKLLHTADWQIGRSYGRFDGEDAAALAAARIEGVKRIAQIANEHQVDAVLVAGDVFDSQTPRDKTVARLFEALTGFDGPWLMLPGNHDAALPESVWEFAKRMDGAVPANCMLCLQPVPVEVTGRNGTPFVVLPAPLTQRHTHTDLTDWFDQAQTAVGLPRIGLAHGSVEGILAEDVDSANPIAADRAERARLDYLALGDWHGAKQVNQRTWYSGTHEPERFRANDPGNCLIVEIAAAGVVPVVRQVPCGRFRWVQLELQVLSPAEVLEAVRQLETVGAWTVADVTISGTCNLTDQERLEAAVRSAALRAAALSAQMRELHLEPSTEELQALHADGFIGAALQELKEQLVGSEPELARDALLALARIQKDIRPAGEATKSGAARQGVTA
jgi:DNA repair exonuclease SbcCD nuclease subunit